MRKTTLSFFVILFSVIGYAQDPTVYITNGGFNYSVIEGNSYDFSVNLYSVSTTDVTVDVITVNNSADAIDYTLLNTTVTILAGELSSNMISIPTTNDFDVEENENFYIEATVTSNNTANSEVIRYITIWDNDTTPTVSTFTTPDLVEGDSRSHFIYLSNYFHSDVTIDVVSSSGTADLSDYNEISESLTIPAGTRNTNFTINTLGDGITESDETYSVAGNITSGNTTNPSFSITVTILDDDTTPTFTLFTSNPYESSNANVSVRLDRAYNSNITIQITTSNGTADNSDYSSISQNRTIPAGSTSRSLTIPINDDNLDEPEESFNVTATVISGNTTNTTESGTITIIDNDGLPDFYIDPIYDNDSGGVNGAAVAEEGFDLKFRPRLRHPSATDTDIVITTTNGSADNSDYTTSTITTTIPAGQIVNFYEVLSYPTVLDQSEEGDENLFINAEVTSASTYNTNYTLEAIILDNYTINAQPDEIISILEVGTTYQVLDNDTFEGLPVDANNLDISFTETNTIGATLDDAGILTVPSGAPLGYYYIDYQICESANPSSCDTATITIKVESPLDVTFTATYVDFNGDGYTSVGDTIEYEYTVTNNGNAPITDIDGEVYFQDIEIVGGPLLSLNPGETDNTTFTATYIITQNDINFGYYAGDQEGANFIGTYYGNDVIEYIYDPNQIFQLQTSDGMKLNAFVDTNGNGTQENDEINFPLGQFNYEINNDGVMHNLFVSPHYLYESNPTTTYDLTYTVDPDYVAYNSTAASYTGVTVPEGSGITTYNFPITVTPYQDLSIDISANWNAPVPGFNYYNRIAYTNNSNETLASGTIDFTMDNALILLETFPTTTTTASGFSYTFSNLEPYQTKYIWVRMEVPTLPTVSLGQLVTNTVDIDVLMDEVSPLDNTSSLTQTIVGSYDPNDITEKYGPEILYASFTSDDYLIYTIRFENTGTANAINIRVEDLLDNQLDETTLKMVDASHNYTLERIDKQLEWNFFGVNLPPSEDDDSEVGHGYITFKIKPLPGYAIGDVIPNTAEIYFDFNPAIITNTWTTTFVEALGVTQAELSNLRLYPNPVNDMLRVENSIEIKEIKITSVLGKQILAKTVDALTTELDLSDFGTGIYFVTIKTDNSEKTLKVVKE